VKKNEIAIDLRSKRSGNSSRFHSDLLCNVSFPGIGIMDMVQMRHGEVLPDLSEIGMRRRKLKRSSDILRERKTFQAI